MQVDVFRGRTGPMSGGNPVSSIMRNHEFPVNPRADFSRRLHDESAGLFLRNQARLLTITPNLPCDETIFPAMMSSSVKTDMIISLFPPRSWS